MTSPDALSASSPVSGLELVRVERGLPSVRAMAARVGEPYGWRSAARTKAEWEAREGEHPLLQYWFVVFEGEPMGAAYLEPQPGGDVEIVTFGLVPDYVGKGFGGYALTLALRQAWVTEPVDAEKVRRVWLHTNSNDHPNALANYRKRGLNIYREDTEAPDGA
ncbi:GNAT family N-acetyltransferase [Streptomyces sp. SID3343]|uniref:GNAT family N-acetyltransferase n=1 Tax=Streptomyces sp. SID3343 TaxID=2690260 RepID=UPI001F3E6CA9|nr:GNAT family N-acetyltransferase [Streptomyces sp. SID3343]